MNKETRQFIWGLILLSMCSYSLLSFWLGLQEHLVVGITVGQLVWDLIMIASQVFGLYQGGRYILKNI